MAGIFAKGDASIRINSQETEARLIFNPDEKGSEWDLDGINKLVAEKNLSPAPDSKVVLAFLSKASRGKAQEPVEEVLYQGIPPEDPVPETITWEPLPIPSDLVSFQDEARSVIPDIYRHKVEKIKDEKTVKKHGALPFISEKEEVVVTWEKKRFGKRLR